MIISIKIIYWSNFLMLNYIVIHTSCKKKKIEINKTKVPSSLDIAGRSPARPPFNPALRKPRKNNNYTYRP